MTFWVAFDLTFFVLNILFGFSSLLSGAYALGLWCWILSPLCACGAMRCQFDENVRRGLE